MRLDRPDHIGPSDELYGHASGRIGLQERYLAELKDLPEAGKLKLALTTKMVDKMTTDLFPHILKFFRET